MPTYEYQCLQCGDKSEAFQKINDKPLTKCTKCKGKLRRIISGGAGVIFKGKGFFRNDYPKHGKIHEE